MPTSHLEFLVEEPSMEAFLRVWAPRHLPEHVSFDAKVFSGKHDLRAKLPSRLKGYRAWMPDTWRIFVVVDKDNDDCRLLQASLTEECREAGFVCRQDSQDWESVACIAIEELEAWYFGHWAAVVAAYPRVSKSVVRQARYREPDAIPGRTWEAFERVLQRHGYFVGGLQKVAAAREIGEHFVAANCVSASFGHFLSAVDEAVA